MNKIVFIDSRKGNNKYFVWKFTALLLWFNERNGEIQKLLSYWSIVRSRVLYFNCYEQNIKLYILRGIFIINKVNFCTETSGIYLLIILS